MSSTVKRICEIDLSITIETKGKMAEIKDEESAELVAKQLADKVKELYGGYSLFDVDLVENYFDEGYVTFGIYYGFEDRVPILEGRPSHNWYEPDDYDEPDMPDEDDMAIEMAEQIQEAFNQLGYTVKGYEIVENNIDDYETVVERWDDCRGDSYGYERD